MKCLLVAINSKYIHSNPAVYLLRECALRDLKQKQIFGVEVELAEYTINHHASEIFDDIYLHHADLVCFSCYIWNIEYVRQLVRNLKNLCPSVKIWVGGPEVSYDCESFLRSLLQVDGVLYGEGESITQRVKKMQIHYPKHFQMGRHGWMKTESSTRQVRSRSHRWKIFHLFMMRQDGWMVLRIELFIMRQAEAVHFLAAIVFHQ